MASKQEILEWFCKNYGGHGGREELSKLIDGLIDSLKIDNVDFAEGMSNLKQRQIYMRMGWNNCVNQLDNDIKKAKGEL